MRKTGMVLLLCVMLIGAGDQPKTVDPIELIEAQHKSIVKGITKLRVFGAISDDFRKEGATEAFILDTIELECRKAGLHITREPFDEKGIGIPCLTFEVYSGSSTQEMLLYTVDLSLMEQVTLSRNGASCNPEVWNRGSFGIVSREDVKQTIREALDEKLTAFLNIYLAANPRSK